MEYFEYWSIDSCSISVPPLGADKGSCVAHCPVWHITIIGKVLRSFLGMKKSTGTMKVFCIAKTEALLNMFVRLLEKVF